MSKLEQVQSTKSQSQCMFQKSQHNKVQICNDNSSNSSSQIEQEHDIHFHLQISETFTTKKKEECQPKNRYVDIKNIMHQSSPASNKNIESNHHEIKQQNINVDQGSSSSMSYTIFEHHAVIQERDSLRQEVQKYKTIYQSLINKIKQLQAVQDNNCNEGDKLQIEGQVKQQEKTEKKSRAIQKGSVKSKKYEDSEQKICKLQKELKLSKSIIKQYKQKCQKYQHALEQKDLQIAIMKSQKQQ